MILQNSHLLASLIGSRICHDLISPVGAIQNGIELLSLEGAVRGPEMLLISDSVSAASAKIRFLRVAFGLAGHGQKIGPPEVCSILDDLSQNGRITYDWTPQGSFDRSDIQEVFLALLCLESAMPQGGTISVTRADDGHGWEVSGPAQLSRPAASVWETLKTGEGTETVMPAHVQFALLPALISERFGTISITETDQGVTVSF
ncbi:histidine phosphotransferase family protein [Pseudooceanicola algae]|uniref:Protein phosphotransferase ChpT n=1 Tax=Pseudooceanicola algae TaxID=1537215 RepID=A0A418SE39_9RHOB|nr:histidine phosphotransferase family protein [Pseudooceanicola algae]QPM89613.1 Protein phosphotransferase ChpT [Pseudooceanicola algae]